MTREETQDLKELTKEFSELRGYLTAELPNLSGRIDTLQDSLEDHVRTEKRPMLSNKQVAAIVGVVVPLLSALTTVLTGLAAG